MLTDHHLDGVLGEGVSDRELERLDRIEYRLRRITDDPQWMP